MNVERDLYSFDNLWRRYIACRSNKRSTLNALAFEVDAEANLFELQAELRAHTYRPGRLSTTWCCCRPIASSW